MSRDHLKYLLNTVLMVLLLVGMGCTSGTSKTVFDELLGSAGLKSGGTKDSGSIVAGLKEALSIGTKNAVGITSKTDGFLGNTLIRIALPKEMQSVAKAMKTIGMGKKVDEIEVAMNRAAEQASGEAIGIFGNAIKKMTLTDAQGILTGGNTAATEYFRKTASDDLFARFHPVIESKMNQVGLVGQYNSVMDRYQKIPFVTKTRFDMGDYVTQKTLDGLFTQLAKEEVKIRTDPAARVTDLLRRTFGS